MTNTTERQNEIAETIRQQIGPLAFAMIGAKNLMALDSGLQFKIGRNARGVTHVTVTLEADDTYTLKFQAVRKLTVTEKSVHPMVFNDQLCNVIQSATGLYTSM